jgi:hypothetical protein
VFDFVNIRDYRLFQGEFDEDNYAGTTIKAANRPFRSRQKPAQRSPISLLK